MKTFLFVVILADRVTFVHNDGRKGAEPHDGTLDDVQKKVNAIKRDFRADSCEILFDTEE